MKKTLSILFFTLILNVSWAQLFKEVSNDIGLDYYFPGIGNQVVGAGITVIDINNDGWEDLFQSGGVFASKLWINQKGKFVDKSKEYGLEVLDKYFVQSSVAADFNKDGFEDLFLSNFGAAKFGGDHLSPLLLMNEAVKNWFLFVEIVYQSRATILRRPGEIIIGMVLSIFIWPTISAS